VARERSFTRAAAKLGMTQSALSQIIRSLEERIGVRLLNRMTRSVTPTQAGERLFLKIGPRFDEIEAELSALSELREKPAGTIRITATEYAAQAILLPALAKILPKYPDIKVEVLIDYGLTNNDGRLRHKLSGRRFRFLYSWAESHRHRSAGAHPNNGVIAVRHTLRQPAA
jgi:DNA-binding transcriptional LysR family regulator